MVERIDKFLMREIDRSVEERKKLWHRDFSSPDAYQKSVQTNRRHFQHRVGAVDPRGRVQALEYVNSTAVLPLVAETDLYRVYSVRWSVFDDVHGEGLFLQPTGEVVARVVAIPDA